MIATLASAVQVHGHTPPLWTVLPFAVFLLLIAVMPLVAHHFWEHNRNKFLFAVAASLPVLLYLLVLAPEGLALKDGSRVTGRVTHAAGAWTVETPEGSRTLPEAEVAFHDSGLHHLADSAKEYVAFIALLGSLFVISGGIYLRGSLAGTPLTNTGFMTIGGLLASFIGTTGASMLLIRPLLRANEKRQRKVHIVVFFIFIVSNGSGMLTPLGDPPLFLGFLRGVPFLWTFKLVLPWLMVNGFLIFLFNLVDQRVLDKEEMERPGSQLEEVQQVKERLSVQGGLNFLWLLGVIGVILGSGQLKQGHVMSHDAVEALQVGGMLAMAALSLLLTPKATRAANKFTWTPILEVAAIFVGIFVTMVPALEMLKANGKALGVTSPWQFFWATGVLSSFLDNAPTYLVFVSLGQGSGLVADNLAQVGDSLILKAISCGAVFMGANTYIGNGPNFMVKAIAEENQVKMPSFFGYMAWSGAILIPVFVVVTLVFFRG